jgi:hypothetical protein
VVGALLGATAEARHDTAYLVGRWVGYALVAAAAWAIFKAVRSGRFKAGLQRIAIDNKASADAQSRAAAGASADVGGIHLHVGHNVAGVGAGSHYDDGLGAYNVRDDGAGDQHVYLPPGADVGAAVRRLTGVPASDGARSVEDAGGSALGPGSAGADGWYGGRAVGDESVIRRER